MNKSNFFFFTILIIFAQISSNNALSLNKKMNLKSKAKTVSSTMIVSKISATITTKQAEEIELFLQNSQKFNEETEKEFKKLDKNNDGVLDENEFRQAINDVSTSFGISPPTETEFRQLFSAFANNKGKLELHNFRIAAMVILQHVSMHFRRVAQARALKDLLNNRQAFNEKTLEGFKEYDKNHDGNLDLSEATEAINFVSQIIGVDKPSSEEVQRIYKSVQNKQGKVGIEEFRSALRYVFEKFVAHYKV
jgi:Ca2+-binding EF-hand superfamily protein